MSKDEETADLIKEAVKAGRVAYQCCFCGKVVESPVTALVLITGWDGPEEEQKSQQWFTHLSCFRSVTGEPTDHLEGIHNEQLS